MSPFSHCKTSISYLLKLSILQSYSNSTLGLWVVVSRLINLLKLNFLLMLNLASALLTFSASSHCPCARRQHALLYFISKVSSSSSELASLASFFKLAATADKLVKRSVCKYKKFSNTKTCLQQVFGYQTCRVTEWLKHVQQLNGPLTECHLVTIEKVR